MPDGEFWNYMLPWIVGAAFVYIIVCAVIDSKADYDAGKEPDFYP